MKDEVIYLFTDVGEFTLDSFMPDGIIKDLPIIGPVFELVKIGKDIHDRIFVEKIKSFIENIDKNQKWKEKFSDEEECNKISKQLLYIVDSCDDDNKLRLIGIAFNYLVNGEISKNVFFYTVNIISKSFYPFLKILLEIDESDERFKNDGTKYDYAGITHLLNIGALDFDGQTMASFNSQTGKIESLPSVIVALNGYSDFLRELLNKMH
ncbi:hypothetical protein GCM10008910_31420 [Faecalicatena orotica]|uniref:Uncharacterized protein n=1 Tax=Faecalicatena orotica TaxID=1544 RepID=A0A2Y9BP75_9FIRM|nr:hypothetical protein [Faecalicatena orotica]PWJ22681.1 hypothetical protein A8806_11721 [Faecalicatena orotica]SSA58124.1 hypothetical protein SAMN05216536_11721 [Faecalicatena orotica]